MMQAGVNTAASHLGNVWLRRGAAGHSCRRHCKLLRPSEALFVPHSPVFCSEKKVRLCHGCRAGELSAQELEQLMVIVSNPRTFKVGLQAVQRGVCLREPRENELCAG